MKELCVIGHPSKVGGADTELDHQIRCWQAMGKTIHICHTGELDENNIKMGLKERGCIYHKPQDWASIEGMDCISFCNGDFLQQLPEIKKYARSTSFVNCMTFNFEEEIEMQDRGLIDFHLYQTEHAFQKVSQKLNKSKYTPLMFKPYFHAEEYPFQESRLTDSFRFGRISRNDPDKFGDAQLWIYDAFVSPLPKSGLIIGWDEKVHEKFGRYPLPFVAAVATNWIPATEFYKFCDAVIMTTNTFENLPRVGFEAMSSGSILIVDKKGGWNLQVESGKTGWLCENEREFTYYSSRMAFEKNERDDMRFAARKKLDSEWGLNNAMDSWEQIFKAWDKL